MAAAVEVVDLVVEVEEEEWVLAVAMMMTIKEDLDLALDLVVVAVDLVVAAVDLEMAAVLVAVVVVAGDLDRPEADVVDLEGMLPMLLLFHCSSVYLGT